MWRSERAFGQCRQGQARLSLKRSPKDLMPTEVVKELVESAERGSLERRISARRFGVVRFVFW